MRKESVLAKKFGWIQDDLDSKFYLADLPQKKGNVFISRIINGRKRGCTFCFPNGIEVTNSKWLKIQRSWKSHRAKQYQISKNH